MRRRILPLVLIHMLLLSAAGVPASAAGGPDAILLRSGDGQTCIHTWTFESVVLEPACDEYGVYAYECAACGETRNEAVDMLAHTFSSDCDAKCDVCEETREPNHAFGPQWSNDDIKHWHTCLNCGERGNYDYHFPGPVATEDRDQYCLTCDMLMTPRLQHTHKLLPERSFDASGHWFACSGCEEAADYAAHSYDVQCDPDCGTCGYTREMDHVFADNWHSDAESHWTECVICGKAADAEDHLWEEGVQTQHASVTYVCRECGAEKTEETAEAQPDGSGWFATGAIILIFSLLSAFFLIRKNKPGKFER